MARVVLTGMVMDMPMAGVFLIHFLTLQNKEFLETLHLLVERTKHNPYPNLFSDL